MKKRLDAEELEQLGAEMEGTQEELLAAGSPRDAVPDQTEEAAQL